jgi:hypothetical protein
MSVQDRIDEARTLFSAHKLEWAFLSALFGLLDTSRKRYPKTRINNEQAAFVIFLKDERAKVSNGLLVKIGVNGRLYRLEDFLYEIVSSSLKQRWSFGKHLSFKYTDELFDRESGQKTFTVTSAFVRRLVNVLETAKENKVAPPF